MKPGRVLLGLVLVALGALFLLDRAGVLDAGETIGDWWPVVIIALGAIQLLDRPRSTVGPGIVIGAGVILLLFELDVIEGSVWNVIWPSALILLGLLILVRHGWRRGNAAMASAEDVVRSTAVFGGNEVASRSQRFRGGSVMAVFGGVTLDLRQAKLAPEGSSLDCTAVFGGVDVLVPRGWKITVSGTPILGGYDDKTQADGPASPDAPELRVDVFALFGGVDVKHEKD